METKSMTKEELLKKAVEHEASEIESWWANAAGDMGYYYEESFSSGSAQKAFKSFLNSCASKEIAREAMADWFHSDVDTIVDCCGDRIYDAATMIRSNPAGFAKEKTHAEIFIMVCEECRGVKQPHATDWDKAMSRLILQEKNHQEKMAKKDKWFNEVEKLTGMNFHALDERQLDPYGAYNKGITPKEFAKSI